MLTFDYISAPKKSRKLNSIKIIDLPAQHARLEPELHEVVDAVINECSFVRGREVALLEQELSAYLGAAHTITCGNGTDALQTALAALRLEDGDEVITTTFSFVATAEAIAHLRLVPVFADVDAKSMNIDAKSIESLITPRTKAIVPVHLYGRPCDMQTVMDVARKHNLYVIEDVAQAMGGEAYVDGKWKKLGTIGHIGCTSFFPTKNLACLGDGGAIFTDDETFAKRAKMYVNHGSERKYHNTEIGINSRLDTIQAAVVRLKLKHLDDFNRRRREVAEAYRQSVNNKNVIFPIDQQGHVYHLFVIRVPNGGRDELKAHLAKAGIETMVHYPVPIHQLPAYSAYKKMQLPESERLAEEVLSLPMHTELDVETVKIICKKIDQWAQK